MDNSTRTRRDEQQVAQRNRSRRHWVSSVVHRRRFAAAVLTLDAVLAALLVIGVASPTPPGAPPATVECHSLGTGPVDNGEAVMATGIAMNIPENGIIIALAAAIHETGMRNLANPNVPASLTVAHDGLAVDHQAVGILAQDPESDAPSELMSPAVAAEKFFTRMRGVNGWESDAAAASGWDRGALGVSRRLRRRCAGRPAVLPRPPRRGVRAEMPARRGADRRGPGGGAFVSTAVSRLAADSDRLARCAAWIQAWTPAVLLRWCWRHRVLTAVLLVGLALLMVGAARAAADPGTGADSGGGDVLISWMGIKDSDNVPVAKYTLTLNQGGWDDPTAKIFSYVDSVVYEVYLCVTATALWLIKFVLDFEWLKLFTGPFQTIGRGVDSAMDRFGLGATALAILAIIVVCTVLAGKTAKAFSNIAMGMLMIGIAATIFANPLAELVGPDGLLAKGRDTGLQIATSVSDGAMTNHGGKANVDDMVARLADRFLRSPTQMINFGVVSDSISRKCKEAWSKGIIDDHGDKLKDDIQGCDSKKGDQMHDRSMGNPAAFLVPLNICGFLAAFLVAFACYFVWHVVRAAVQAMLYAALAPPAFAIGVIPGGPQTFAWKTVLDCAMAFAAMVIYTAAFGAYNVILDQVFKESTNAIQSIFMTTLVLAFGFAFFGPLRRMFDRHRDIMAAKLGGGAAGGSGRGWFSKAADLSRLKGDLLPGGGRAGSNKRAPGRIEPESDSSSSSGGGPGGGPGGGDGDPAPGPVSVSDPAAGDSAGGQGSAGAGSEAETSPDAGDRQRAPQPAEPVAADTDHSRVQDRLAEAIRIYRASRGGGAGSGGGRHALSEAA